MKRLFTILLIVFIVLTLGACGKDRDNDDIITTNVKTTQKADVTPTEEQTDIYEIDWGKAASDDIIGAWEPADENSGNFIVLFTAERTIRFVNGSTYIEAEVEYGEDSAGNISVCAFSSYLSGTWTYEVKDDTLKINYPVLDENNNIVDYKYYKFNSIDYSPATLNVSEEFTPVDELIGVWSNSESLESFEFTEDGYAIYKYEDVVTTSDGEKFEITCQTSVYGVTDSTIVIHYIYADEVISESFEYEINGTELTIDGQSKFYLISEGDTALSEA